MQTKRELIDCLIRGNKAERVGLKEGIWDDTIAAWVQQGYPVRSMHKVAGETCWRREDGRWVDVEKEGDYEEPVPPWEHFEFDMVEIKPRFDILPIRDHDELVSETNDWEVRRNGAGAALKFWKHKSGTPEHIDFRMVTREIWEQDYRPHLLTLDPDRVKVEEMLKTKAELNQALVWTHYSHIFIFELMRKSMGDTTMYESLLLDPGWIRDYNEVYTAFFKEYYRYVFEKVGIPDGVWLLEDLGYKNGLFASPKVLRELVFPFYKEMIDFFHSYDLPVILHSCGSTAQALPLIVDAGFDALNPIERKAKDNDPFVFAEKYGDKLAFVGGVDARVFETNDREIIRREVITFLEGMKSRGARLIFGSDHSISTNTRYASYQYALDIYREHMAY